MLETPTDLWGDLSVALDPIGCKPGDFVRTGRPGGRAEFYFNLND